MAAEFVAIITLECINMRLELKQLSDELERVGKEYDKAFSDRLKKMVNLTRTTRVLAVRHIE